MKVYDDPLAWVAAHPERYFRSGEACSGLWLSTSTGRVCEKRMRMDRGSDSLVVAAVKRRLLDPARRVDYPRLAPSSLPAPAAGEVLAATERALGFRLLPLHAALFSGVANGGFGPGDGLIGLDGGNADGDGRTLLALHRDIVASFYPATEAPIVPLLDWGDGIWCGLDSETGQVLTIDETGVKEVGSDFASWMLAWAEGTDHWSSVVLVEERILRDPFSKQRRPFRVVVGTKGTPYVPPADRD